MAAVPNSIPLSGPIAPFDAEDNYPTHISKYGVGGFYAVDNYAALDNIPTARLGNGEPLILLRDTKQLFYYYDSAWVELTLGGGDCCTVLGSELDGDQVIQLTCTSPTVGTNWFFDNFNTLNNTQLTGAGDLVT